jgi:DNA-binding response OmpR family regulator
MTKVLILTSDNTLKHLVESTLNFNGFTLHFVSNTKSAWKFLREVFFDFIMIDFQLPNESGLGFYKSIREYGSHIPVIMIGEGAFDEFILKDLSNESYDYILRPFKFIDLKPKINQILQGIEMIELPSKKGYIHIDLKNGIVQLRDQITYLSKVEMNLLILLVKKAGHIVDLKKMRTLLGSEDRAFNFSIVAQVNSLSEKLKMSLGESIEIILIKNQGFKLEMKA